MTIKKSNATKGKYSTPCIVLFIASRYFFQKLSQHFLPGIRKPFFQKEGLLNLLSEYVWFKIICYFSII